jgi:predicted negative regulator of RcsB-dependent stress response
LSAPAIKILRNLKTTKAQAASLNKVLVHIEDGKLDVARQFLLERLADPVSAYYRKEVLNTLLKVSNLQLEQCHDLNCKKFYQQEILALLQKLLGQTGDPFYHYRIGQFLLSVGEREVARENFLAAFEKLPESSLYKEPAGRLAGSLGK